MQLELGDSAIITITIFSQNTITIVKLSQYLVLPQPYMLYFMNASIYKILIGPIETTADTFLESYGDVFLKGN